MKTKTLLWLLALTLVPTLTKSQTVQIIIPMLGPTTAEGAVRYVGGRALQSGEDIGQEIDEAYASLPPGGGTIIVVADRGGNCYDFSTPVVAAVPGKYLLLEGGSGPSQIVTAPLPPCLNYIPTTGSSAITLDYVVPGHNIGLLLHGIRNLTLTNNHCQTMGGCGSNATGVTFGGANGGVQGATFSGLRLGGFGTALNVLSSESSAGNISFHDCTLSYNARGFSDIQADAEHVSFEACHFQGNGTGLSSSASITVSNSTLDSNTILAVNCSSPAACDLNDDHFESGNADSTHFLAGTGVFSVLGGDMRDDRTNGTTDWWMNFAGASFFLVGTVLTSGGRSATQVILNATPSGTALVQNNSADCLTNLYSNPQLVAPYSANLTLPRDGSGDGSGSGQSSASSAIPAVATGISPGDNVTAESNNATIRNPLLCKNFANTRCISVGNPQGWSGSNEGSWINSSILDVQKNSSLNTASVDARGLGATGTISSDIFSSTTVPAVLYTGATQFAISATSNPVPGTTLLGLAGFQGEPIQSTGRQTVWKNMSNTLYTFNLNAPLLSNISIQGMNFDGAGNNGHIFVKSAAGVRIKDNSFRGKSHGLVFDATLGSVYDEQITENLFVNASDSILFTGGGFQSPNYRIRDNWFRKDDACCRSGKGINIPPGTGISGDITNNACSGMTDSAHGTCFEFGSSLGLVIGANDIESITAGGGNFFPMDLSNANGYSVLANNWYAVPGGIFAGGNYGFIAPQYFTSLQPGANYFLQFAYGGVGNVLLGAPLGKTSLFDGGGGKTGTFIEYDSGALQVQETSALGGLVGFDNLWPDFAAHRWMMNNNNGGADVVIGAATSDTLSNKTLSSPVISGSSSGTGVQGTDPKLLSVGNVSGVGSPLCLDANGGATTSGCGASRVQATRLGPSCRTGGNSYWSCTNTLTWPIPFPDTNYVVTCSGIGPSDPRGNITVAARSPSEVTVNVVTYGARSVWFAEIDCTGVHNQVSTNAAAVTPRPSSMSPVQTPSSRRPPVGPRPIPEE